MSDYDDDLKPQFHTDDPYGSARSQELASKNNLKKNYIDLKRRNGPSVEFVERDDIASATGSNLEAIGQTIAEAKYREAIGAADVLSEDEFLDIKHRIEDNQDVSIREALASQRSWLERFYRQPVSDELFDLDDRGRFREKILRFESFIRYARHIGSRNDVKSEEYSFRLRFVRDEREAGRVLHDLLASAGVFKDGKFDTQSTYHSTTLQPFMRKAQDNKAVIENIFKIEVRKKSTAAVAQLGAVLNLIGLEQRLAGTTKAKSLAGGKKVYLYRISEERLQLVETIASRRLSLSGWNFIRTHCGVPNQLTSN